MMEFRIQDPLGNTVTLTKECWLKHILKEHPEIKSLYQELYETIRNPDYIFQSRISKNAQLYFKGYLHPKYGYFYIMAVVDYKTHKKSGFVKTSFPVYNLNKGGELIWKKS